ncbi:MAG: SDR family NAD(P)-dependent oxidoreductase [Chloroflexota bacterium]|nr:SDR family NAD(P)-dependent oxidoreductase [Anaerolineaceae bacterium]MDE2776132.1 SDR family NAD(P)-dependent oxidoreductase [Chloroflexota bacterium]
MSLLGKTALITGAGRGIGKGCALALARRGATVVVNDRPASPDLAGTATEIKRAGGEALAVEADVFSRDGCASLVNRTLKQVEGIDILVSNPAYSVRGAFLDYDPEVFERVLQGTLVAGFHIGQLVARHMAARGKGGKIVFISSVHASIPLQNAIAYNAAKAGLNHMALSIARELVPHKINVNVIEPGWIDTPGEHETFGAEALAEGGRALPWKRLGSPADIGSAAAFLSSAEADYITGTIMRVDGGYMHKDA